MEQFFYSMSQGNFLRGSLRDAYEAAGTWPKDVRIVPEARYNEFVAGRAEGKSIVLNAMGKLELADPPPPPPPTVDMLCAQIDVEADNARQTVAGDPLRAVEYERAAREAEGFKDAGYPESDVPRSVAAGAINGKTPQETADEILSAAAQYHETLYQIREHRLQAKADVRALYVEGDSAPAERRVSDVIDALRLLADGHNLVERS
jgi:hypothetical protein